MSVQTMTLHQARNLISTTTTSSQLSNFTYTQPPFPRGTKRSRHHDSLMDAPSQGITRTQKRSMGMSQSDWDSVREKTISKLFDAQKKLERNVIQFPSSSSPSSLHLLQRQQQQHDASQDVRCVECGHAKTALRAGVIELTECQGCFRIVCKNCSIWKYLDTGDYEACFTCSQQ